MRGFLPIFILFSAILAVIFADLLPLPRPSPDQPEVPSPPDDIPPFDPQPHPETKPSKPFPGKQPPFDPPPYPETKPSNPFPDEQPSSDSQPYPGSGPEQDSDLSRFRRSTKDDNNDAGNDVEKTAGIGPNVAGLSKNQANTPEPKNQAKTQFAASGNFPWD